MYKSAESIDQIINENLLYSAAANAVALACVCVCMCVCAIVYFIICVLLLVDYI